jgi:hypothetical protein
LAGLARQLRRARRSIQADMPLEIFDASTTDVTAVAAHHHRQPTGYACLSCIYPTFRKRMRGSATLPICSA